METEGKRVAEAQKGGQLPIAWSAADCKVDAESATTRVYFGSDGVLVPVVTDKEKRARREKIKAKRRRRGRKAKALPPRRAGADQKYKEFKIIAFYDETQDHRVVLGTRGDCDVAPMHLFDAESGAYNAPFLGPDLRLVPGYLRRQGICFRPGDRRFEGKDAKAAVAAALADPTCRVQNRNRGSGTRALVDGLLGGARPVGGGSARPRPFSSDEIDPCGVDSEAHGRKTRAQNRVRFWP